MSRVKFDHVYSMPGSYQDNSELTAGANRPSLRDSCLVQALPRQSDGLFDWTSSSSTHQDAPLLVTLAGQDGRRNGYIDMTFPLLKTSYLCSSSQAKMAILSLAHLAGAAVLIFIGVLIVRLRSPLASLPGPRLGLLTPWQLRYHELRGKRTQYVHRMHQKYGNAVRVAPNEIVFSSLDAMKEIYLSKGSGFDKTSFYNLFSQFGLRSVDP